MSTPSCKFDFRICDSLAVLINRLLAVFAIVPANLLGGEENLSGLQASYAQMQNAIKVRPPRLIKPGARYTGPSLYEEVAEDMMSRAAVLGHDRGRL